MIIIGYLKITLQYLYFYINKKIISSYVSLSPVSDIEHKFWMKCPFLI